MTLPNFLIIGTQKAGTSSLHTYLSQHPEVYMCPIGESRFFTYDPDDPEHRSRVPHVFPITTLEAYARLFNGVSNEKAIGEKSPDYLNSPGAAVRIRQSLPDIKLIVSLRNPVDRAYSHYQMEVRGGRQKGTVPPRTFSVEERWIQVSLYFTKVKRYLDLFPKDHVKIILFEDFVSHTSDVLKDIFRFLDVDDGFEPADSTKQNPGGIPKSRVLFSLLKHRRFMHQVKPLIPDAVRSMINRMREKNLEKAPPLEPHMRKQLSNLYYDDILRLQDLLTMDLSIWMKDRPAN